MRKRYETDPKALLTAKEVAFNGRPVKIRQGHYGGWRLDRLKERNKVTNALGLTECHGRDFLILESPAGSEPGTGTFLANALADAAKGIDTLRVDGVQLWPQTGFVHRGGYFDYIEAPPPEEEQP